MRVVALLSASLVAAGMLVATSFAEPAQAEAFPDTIIDGGYIISDEEFFDSRSMTVSQIQAFLDEQVPVCDPDAVCLKDFTQTHPNKDADQYCAALRGGSDESAAGIIYKAAIACGINPKVLIVMLQKEQSLVTMTNPSQTRFDRAMGYACPDSGPNNSANCDRLHYGFANQVYRAARQMQVYTKDWQYFRYQPGQVNTIQWNPTASCGTSRVYIQNRATANLYTYTPYRANLAALAAGWGSGDGCSSYGNRNFYNYYITWFEPDAAKGMGAPAQIDVCTLPPASEITSRNRAATVNATLVYVRQAPSVLCSQDIQTLARGAEVTVTGRYGAWSSVTVGDVKAWLLSDYLTTAEREPENAPSEIAFWVEAATDLNLRGAGSFTAQVLTVIPNGTVIPAYETVGDWHRVSVGRLKGWVHGDFVNDANKVTTLPMEVSTLTKLNLRRYTSMGAPVLAVIPVSTKLQVTQVTGPWFQVTYGGFIGWIHSDYVS